MIMTVVQFRNAVRKLGESNGPTGPLYFYPDSAPFIQVRFSKTSFSPNLSDRLTELRNHVRDASRGVALITSEEWMLKEGFMEIMVNPCGDQVSLKDALSALTWLNSQILSAKR